MTITGYFVNAETGEMGARTIERGLDNYYKLLNCDTIDIVARRFGGRLMDVICDDEGLLKDGPIVTVYNVNCKSPMLVGSIFIVRHDGHGNEISLNAKDIEALEKCRAVACTADGKKRPVLVGDWA